jgi:hypothetical protein
MHVQCCGFVFGFRDLLGLVGLMPLGALYPSKSGQINKHTVKHIATVAKYLGLETFCGSLRGQCFIFGALCPSKSGLMNKHIVKHRS